MVSDADEQGEWGKEISQKMDRVMVSNNKAMICILMITIGPD